MFGLGGNRATLVPLQKEQRAEGRGGQTLEGTKGISQEHICGKRVSLPGGSSKTCRRQQATGMSPGVFLMFRENGDIGIQNGQDLHWYH